MGKTNKMKTKCPLHKIEILENRKIINCDKLKFAWKQDSKGYFLVKLKNQQICCGFVNPRHKMIMVFRAKNPDKIIKEIAKRKLCNLENMGYIASELMLAKYCLEKNKKYVQR